MRIGAQFYTIRDFCKTPEALAESLKKVADIGYTTVQISGTCAFDAVWMKDQLQKNGLECVITHTAADRLQKETEAVCSEHDIFGCRYIGLGWYGFDPEKGSDTKAFAELYTPVARSIAEKGHYFMYHNHAGEFQKENGVLVLEKLADIMPADIMGFTLDTYWVQVGGGDPAQWIEKLSGRVPCIHLKDYAYGARMEAIGSGNINFERVFEKAEAAGTDFMLVEQDDCNGEDPFACLKRSYDYLKSCGFN